MYSHTMKFRAVFALYKVRMSSIHCVIGVGSPSTNLHLLLTDTVHMYIYIAVLLLRTLYECVYEFYSCYRT